MLFIPVQHAGGDCDGAALQQVFLHKIGVLAAVHLIREADIVPADQIPAVQFVEYIVDVQQAGIPGRRMP